jgi:LemA protein
LTATAGRGLYFAATIWLFYLAVEPYLRRRWPESVVGWARLLSGSWKDPMIGRDVLVGTLFATGTVAATIAVGTLVAPPSPIQRTLLGLLGTRRLGLPLEASQSERGAGQARACILRMGIPHGDSTMKKTIGAVLGCVALLLLIGVIAAVFVAGIYNRLVGLEEGVEAAWSQVENVYQRRADLIPNLVETVRGARDFERETLTAVVEARARVGQVNIQGAPSAAQLESFQQAQDGLSSALSRLLVVVERYPELTATQNFRDLQVQLEGTENRIAVERRRFNEAARAFNTARRRVPAIFVARILGFDEKPYFEAVQGADQAPAVDF